MAAHLLLVGLRKLSVGKQAARPRVTSTRAVLSDLSDRTSLQSPDSIPPQATPSLVADMSELDYATDEDVEDGSTFSFWPTVSHRFTFHRYHS